MSAIEPLGRLDAERVTHPEPPLDALRRRVGGRYPVDPFGLDPQVADVFQPLFAVAVRVRVVGVEHVPKTGPAVVVANRGLGVVEPIALGLAVSQATGRRLRHRRRAGCPVRRRRDAPPRRDREQRA